MGLNFGKIAPVAYDPTNPGANVSLDYKSDIPRIRYGGNGAGSANGFQIQGTSDAVKMSIDDNGNVTIPGILKIGNTKQAVDITQLASVLGNSGYQMFPGGLIINWGLVPSCATGTVYTVNLAKAFPSVFVGAVTGVASASGASGYTKPSLSQIGVLQTQGNTRDVFYIAIGY